MSSATLFAMLHPLALLGSRERTKETDAAGPSWKALWRRGTHVIPVCFDCFFFLFLRTIRILVWSLSKIRAPQKKQCGVFLSDFRSQSRWRCLPSRATYGICGWTQRWIMVNRSTQMESGGFTGVTEHCESDLQLRDHHERDLRKSLERDETSKPPELHWQKLQMVFKFIRRPTLLAWEQYTL